MYMCVCACACASVGVYVLACLCVLERKREQCVHPDLTCRVMHVAEKKCLFVFYIVLRLNAVIS